MTISYILSTMHEFEKYISLHTGELIVFIILFFIISVLSGEKMNVRFLALYLLVILYMTILSRTAGRRRMSLRPFASYRYFFTDNYFRHQVINNILLFIPLGIILSQLRPRRSTARLIPCISLGVEILQFVTARGLFETDDLIGNTLGGLIGFTAGMLWILMVCQVQRLFHAWHQRKKDLETGPKQKKMEL